MNQTHHPVRVLVLRIVIGVFSSLIVCDSVQIGFAADPALRQRRLTLHVVEPPVFEEEGPASLKPTPSAFSASIAATSSIPATSSPAPSEIATHANAPETTTAPPLSPRYESTLTPLQRELIVERRQISESSQISEPEPAVSFKTLLKRGTETSDTETSDSETSGSETSGSETSGSETSGSEMRATETSGSETSGSEMRATETSGTETRVHSEPPVLPSRLEQGASPVLVRVDAPLSRPSTVTGGGQGSEVDQNASLFAFEPIGSLNADVSIGIAGTDADVLPSNRPVNRMPSPETISMTGQGEVQNWQTASPMSSVSAHQPLYFEDVNLERYGTSRNKHCQPIISGARFCFDAASLPYQMTLQPPRMKHRYPHAFEAGRFCRRESTSLPWDRDASLAEAVAILGLIALIP